MTYQGEPDDLALPAATAAFQRVADAVAAEQGADVLTRPAPEVRARALAEAMLEGIATGRPWDDEWYSGNEPAVADDHLVAALLAASASLLHLGAEAAGLEPEQFLREALRRRP